MGMDDVGQTVTDFVKVILAVMIIIVLISMSILLMDVVFPVSNQNSSFTGNVESFNIAMPNPYMSFKAESIGLSADIVVFRSVKNILIDYNNGTETRVDYLPAIQVEYNKTVAQPISDVEMSLLFNDVVIDKFSNHADIYGKLTSIDRIKSNDEKVRIYKDGVNSVSINGTNVTDFKQIFFEMVGEGKLQIISGDIFISVTNISGLDTEKVKFSKITIRNGEGELGLDGHDFDIKTIDDLNIEILSKSDSFITIDNDNVHFDGIATSAKLNNDNILVNEYRYLLKFKPEKINAYATLGLVFITIVYVFFTGQMVELTKNSHEQTNESIRQTENAIEEMRTERKMTFIMKRLEEFYYPLCNLLKTYVWEVQSNANNKDNVMQRELSIRFKASRKDKNDVLDYTAVVNRQYLAESDTKAALDYFLKFIIVKDKVSSTKDLDCYDKFVVLIKRDISKLRDEFEILLDR